MKQHFETSIKPTGCDVPFGSVMELPTGVDEAGSQPLQSQHAQGQIAGEPKPVDSVSSGQPGPRVPIHKIMMQDKVWQYIGSGIVARTFKQVSKLRTTSPGGPCMDDIFTTKGLEHFGPVLNTCGARFVHLRRRVWNILVSVWKVV